MRRKPVVPLARRACPLALCLLLASCAAAPGPEPLPPATAPAGLVEMATSAPTSSPSPAPTPTAAPSPAPAPTPDPTPAPDPAEAFFLPGEGEEVAVSEDRAHYSYKSRDLSVVIEQREMAQPHLRYFVAHIRTRGEQRIRFGYGDGKAPGAGRFKPYIIARKYQAVFAQNADFFIEPENPKGVVMRGGKAYADEKDADTLAVLPDGSLQVFRKGEINAKELLAMGVEDAVSFGPALVVDGAMAERLDRARLSSRNPRSGLGMIKPGHFVSIVVDGRMEGFSAGATLVEFAQMFLDEGCLVAYNMDGGMSSGMVFMGDSCNTHAYNPEENVHGQRPVPDIFYFGTSAAVPAVKDKVVNDGQGNVKPTEKVPTKTYDLP